LSAVLETGAVRPLPPLGLAAATAVVAWREQGSLAASDWLPLAVLAALVAATVALAGVAVRPSRAVLLAGGSLVLLAGWTAASTAWSPSPSGARDEALLVGLYALCLLLGPLVLPGVREQRRTVAGLTGVLAVLGALAALKLALAADPAVLLFGGRLDFPVSYVNACAARFVLGFWPAVATAARRDAHGALRAGAAGAAALFLALGIAAQSKGAVLGLAVSALLVFALSPLRLRLLVPVLLAAAPAAAAAAPLTAPYRSGATVAAHRAGWAALAVAVAGVVLGAAYAAVDARLELGEARRRRLGRTTLALTLGAVAAALAAFVLSVSSPRAWVAHEWRAFKHPNSGQVGSSHLSALGSNRYDFWRVALDEARTHPLRGIGGRGFYSAYLEHRRSPETPLRAHSLYLDTLAEEGIPGLLLLLLGLGAPLVLLARRLRSPVAVAAFGAGTYFAAHAAVDWIWTVPVVGVFALLLLGSACGEEDAPRLRRPTSVGVAVASIAAAAFAFAPPWLAARYVAAAYHSASPSADLARARALDPLSLDPYWAEWRLARTPAAQIRALVRAHALEPSSVAVLYNLALTYERAGRRSAAVAALRQAARLDPRDPIVRSALRSADR
jgi:O-antigen ligase